MKLHMCFSTTIAAGALLLGGVAVGQTASGTAKVVPAKTTTPVKSTTAVAPASTVTPDASATTADKPKAPAPKKHLGNVKYSDREAAPDVQPSAASGTGAVPADTSKAPPKKHVSNVAYSNREVAPQPAATATKSAPQTH